MRDSWGIGVPVTFLRRAVLACDDFEKARDMLLHAKRCVSNNMLLASGNGCAVDIEAYPNGANVLAPSGGILTHANHFVVHQYLDSRVGPKNRDLRLEVKGLTVYDELGVKRLSDVSFTASRF